MPINLYTIRRYIAQYSGRACQLFVPMIIHRRTSILRLNTFEILTIHLMRINASSGFNYIYDHITMKWLICKRFINIINIIIVGSSHIKKLQQLHDYIVLCKYILICFSIPMMLKSYYRLNRIVRPSLPSSI